LSAVSASVISQTTSAGEMPARAVRRRDRAGRPRNATGPPECARIEIEEEAALVGRQGAGVAHMQGAQLRLDGAKGNGIERGEVGVGEDGDIVAGDAQKRLAGDRHQPALVEAEDRLKSGLQHEIVVPGDECPVVTLFDLQGGHLRQSRDLLRPPCPKMRLKR
jgi:hypothetical protein